jgi:hypothetical protein
MSTVGGMITPIVIVVAFLLVVTLVREMVRFFLRRSVLIYPKKEPWLCQLSLPSRCSSL